MFRNITQIQLVLKILTTCCCFSPWDKKLQPTSPVKSKTKTPSPLTVGPIFFGSIGGWFFTQFKFSTTPWRKIPPVGSWLHCQLLDAGLETSDCGTRRMVMGFLNNKRSMDKGFLNMFCCAKMLKFFRWDLEWEVILGHLSWLACTEFMMFRQSWKILWFEELLSKDSPSRMTRIMVIQEIGLKEGNMGSMTHSGFESYPKGPCLECRLQWPFVCKNDLWRKLKLEFAKVLFIAKVLAKDYVYIHVDSVQMFCSKGRMAMASETRWLRFVPWYHHEGILWIYSPSVIFYFAKILGVFFAKVWRKFS